ncbi:1-acyl-sn-glycerol-3-phosphate acyltransferase [Rickettsiales bacterium]|nr:1-acyl-sn-glycerol-3-phosphate acyltransferase [Rickettsiales bacterium]
MTFIRSILFNIFFPIWTAFICISMIPLLFTPQRIAAFSGYAWSFGVIWGLRIICGVKYEIRGVENLPTDKPFILASKHQSVWDTAIFLYLLNKPSYVMKQELLKIPLYGNYLTAIGMIPVDRSGGSKALKDMVNSIKDRLSKGRSVVIFPEGTRTFPGQKISYQPGVAFAYLEKDIDAKIIPVSLNSGLFWNKKDFLHPSGKITVQYHPAIEEGLNRKSFMKKLEDTVEGGQIDSI